MILRASRRQVPQLAASARIYAAAPRQARGMLSSTAGADDEHRHRLAFHDDEYGPAETNPKVAGTLEKLRKASAEADAATALGEAKVHAQRAMYDSSLSQASDNKTSASIKREVAADTPDATRLALNTFVYGEASVPEEEARAAEAIRARVEGGGASAGPASPIHDTRAMYDSSLSQSSDDKTADSIKRDVAADTPDATRLALNTFVYGEASVPEDEARAAEAIRARVAGGGVPTGPASPIHDSRSMYDSSLSQSSDDKTADSIKREVVADTPDATRLALNSFVYGEAAVPEDEARAAEALKARVGGGGPPAGPAPASPPIHDHRSMYDSALGDASDDKTADSIKREVAADTPDATRLALNSFVYGEAAVPEDEAAAAEALKARVAGTAAPLPPPMSAPASQIHDHRAMYDSALGDASCDKTAGSIKREVVADTPFATRVALNSFVYGEGEVPEEEVRAVQDLKAQLAANPPPQAPAARIHSHRAMFDSDLVQASGDKTADSIKREVATDTPDQTRLSFFASTYGEGPVPENEAAAVDVEGLKSKHGARPAVPAARKAKIHDTQKAFRESVYGMEGSD